MILLLLGEKAGMREVVKHSSTQRRKAAKALGKIPKGFRPSAQRCHDNGGATLGGRMEMESTPTGLSHLVETTLQPALGLEMIWTVDPG